MWFYLFIIDEPQVLLFVNGTNNGDQASVTLYYRPLGSAESYSAAKFDLVAPARAVFTLSLPPQVLSRTEQ